MLGTGPLLGHALQSAWGRPAFGTGPSKCLGKARSWDNALQNAWDRPALGTGPLCLFADVLRTAMGPSLASWLRDTTRTNLDGSIVGYLGKSMCV